MMRRVLIAGLIGALACGPGEGGSSEGGSTGAVSSTGGASTTGASSGTDTGAPTTGDSATSGTGTTDATSGPGTTDATTGEPTCEDIVGSTDCALLVAVSKELTLAECEMCQGAACGAIATCDGQYPCVDGVIVLRGCCFDHQCTEGAPFCGQFLGTNNVCVLQDDQ